MTNDLQDLTGQVLKGYELRQLLGRGGFGVVYRAYQPIVEREVALKIILPEYANHPNFIRRFETEAQVVARLEHIHIVPLFDYWREPDSACFVMRLMRGGSLQESIDQQGAWDTQSTARLLDQLAAALTVAHRNGIIHRDLKPANVLLDEDKNAYLADFGIAKNLVADPQVNAEEDRFGSPAYISPEQVMGQPVSAQTDIYSLGVVLYMMLTGRTPFLDPSTTTVIRRHLSDTLPPLQSVRADLPHALNLVIWRATNKNPQARYPDALSLAAHFRQVISTESFAGLRASSAAAPAPPRVVISPVGRTLPIDQPLEPENPYKGLRAFQEADAADFFGRKTLIERLVKRLSEAEAGARFLAVVGASGSGKSSVVKAGMLPALRRGHISGSEDWFFAQMTPGALPFAELEAALLRVAAKAPEGLLEQLHSGERGLVEAVNRLLPVDDGDLLLLIDQFEEVFTLVSDEAERARFFKCLLTAAAASDSRLRLIITLRADFYDRPLQYPDFGDLLRRRTEIVLPLNSSEMEQAILGPAERIGLRFEPGLVSAIITDVSQQPGGLPLLQFALTELFEQREGFNLTLAAYRTSGGALGALARRADELYDLLDAISRRAARELFLRLVSLGEGLEDTKRRILQAEVRSSTTIDPRTIQFVIDQFSRHRLLTADYEPATRSPTVEIAHEALIRVWDRLKNWLDANRDDLRLHQRLAEVTTEWLKMGKDGSYLASGSRLGQFESLVASDAIPLNIDEADYLRASMDARERAARRLRLFIAGLAVFSVIALALALFAFDRQRAAESETARADTQASVARSRELAVTALTGVDQTDLALLLSLESLRAANTFEARNSLLTALQAHPAIKYYLPGTDTSLRSLAVSPDGRMIVSAGRTLARWDAQTGQPIGEPLSGHDGWINSVAFGPDGQIIASASADNTIRLWNAQSGQPLGEPLEGHTDAVWSLAFSPDGTTLASGSADLTILLWGVATRQPLADPLSGHEDTIYALAFSPDGAILASGSGDNTVRLWDATTGEPLGDPLTGHTNWVLSVAFSPTLDLLASAGADATIRFWDATTGEPAAERPTNHTNWVRSLAFSPDGRFFATASLDNTLRLWDATTGEPLGEPLSGHTAGVWSAAFIPESDLLLSAGADGKVIAWDTRFPPPLGLNTLSHGDSVLSLAYSPDGQLLASAGGNFNQIAGDHTIKLWNVASSALQGTLEGHQRYITGIAFSPDGQTIASASADQSIRLWNLASGDMAWVSPLKQSSDYIPLAFSPDGQTLASGDETGQITLWDTTSGEATAATFQASADILTLAFNPDGNLLAAGGKDGAINLWDMSRSAPLYEPLLGHRGEVNAIGFSPDGSKLVSASDDDTLILWDVNSGKMLGQALVGHRYWVASVAFSPDGEILASGSEDGELLLWDVSRGELIGQPFVDHTNGILGLAFSPDGQSLAAADLDGAIILRDVALVSWQNRACSIANRSLTPDEWQRYLPDLAYRPTCPIAPPQ